MSRRQIRAADDAAEEPRVCFEIREVMSLLAALESRATREEPRHVR